MGLINNLPVKSTPIGADKVLVIDSVDGSTKIVTASTLPTAGAGHTIQDEGTPLTTRAGLNFVGAGVTATDDSGNSRTNVTIPGYTPRQAAYQAVAYTATLTIDPTAGAVVQVGALTGNITIAAPTSPQNGDVLQINLVQDATGGRTVTWNAVFDADSVANQPVNTVASKRTQVSFVYSGGVWQ